VVSEAESLRESGEWIRGEMPRRTVREVEMGHVLDTYFAAVTANTTRGPRIRSINHARAAVTFRLQEIYEQLHAQPPPHTTAWYVVSLLQSRLKRYPLATLQILPSPTRLLGPLAASPFETVGTHNA